MSGSTRPSVRARLWQGPRLKLTSIGAALAVLVAFGIQADQPTRIPVSVSCDDIGYAYDAAGQLVGVQDRANQTARYASYRPPTSSPPCAAARPASTWPVGTG